jgi:hypothetical protein
MTNRIRLGWLSAPALLLASAAAASAADVKFEDGRVQKLEEGSEVVGPATITADNGKDTVILRKGAVLRYLPTQSEQGIVVENLFLKSGAADVDTSFNTRVATPAFWAYPEKATARAAFYVETFDSQTAYARLRQSDGRLRLFVSQVGNNVQEAQLGPNQGLTLQRSGGSLRFTTDPHNEWESEKTGLAGVRVVYPLSTGLLVDLYVPKATTGSIGAKAGQAGKTDVSNMVTSWKSGKVRIQTSLGGSMTGEGNIGPGISATIDNASGRIETGISKVEFATLKAAVSLTSEFESLATSSVVKP